MTPCKTYNEETTATNIYVQIAIAESYTEQKL